MRAVDARSHHAMTCDTWLMLGVADTIPPHPVHTMDGASTRLGLSKRVDQQTGSGHLQSRLLAAPLASPHSVVVRSGRRQRPGDSL